MASPDTGTVATLAAVDGKPVWTRTALGQVVTRAYDALRRPVAVTVDDGTTARVVERVFYGEDLASGAVTANAIGKPVLHYDEAGLLRADSYDFEGHPHIRPIGVPSMSTC